MFDNLSLLGLVPMLNLQLLLDGLLIGSVFALAPMDWHWSGEL
ncbi:MAG: hypothetical protein Ct9H300mP28_28190 [Pseudomonadota bacterium]|nr:MAG: hypothetical protein Ct9H300mP28_28190 [Pseudomonadota bacterium]